MVDFDTSLFLKCRSAKKRVQKVTLKNLKYMQAASSTDMQFNLLLFKG